MPHFINIFYPSPKWWWNWKYEGSYKTREPVTNGNQELEEQWRTGAESTAFQHCLLIATSKLYHTNPFNRDLSRADVERVLFISPLKGPEALTTELLEARESTCSKPSSPMHCGRYQLTHTLGPLCTSCINICHWKKAVQRDRVLWEGTDRSQKNLRLDSDLALPLEASQVASLGLSFSICNEHTVLALPTRW